MFKLKFLVPIVLALALRLFLMSSTYHPDLAGQSLSAYFWGFKNITNIYEHLLSLPQTHPLVRNFGVSDIFIYPPLTYFALGTFQKIFAFTGLQNFLETVMGGSNIYLISGLNFYLFVIKFPYLFFDLAVAYLLYGYFDNAKNKYTALLLWLFNPLTLYSTYAMGVFDIIPVFFTVLSAYYLKKKKISLSSLSLGLGIAFKMYPVFLLPFIIFKSRDNLKDKLKNLFISLLPVILTNLPYIYSHAYRYMVFSPKSQKMMYMQFMLSGAEGLYPFLLILVLLYLFAHSASFKPKYYISYFLTLFLLLFSVTHYHPQWFIWMSPFLIIEVINYKFQEWYLYLALLIIFVFIVFTFENSLSLGLFAPLNQNLSKYIGTQTLLSQHLDLNQIKSYARSIFAAISAYLAITHLSKSAK